MKKLETIIYGSKGIADKAIQIFEEAAVVVSDDNGTLFYGGFGI